ncbi:MAG: dockerin type I domain-containing protein [Planctomycetota bacterium]
MADTAGWRNIVQNGQMYYCEADGNYDGVVNLLDVAPFRSILLEYQTPNFENATIAGPSDFFWSTQNLGEGAVNQSLELNLPVGESRTLYLYYSLTGPSASEINDGASINVATSSEGTVTFEDGGVYNFPVQIFNTTVGQRWGYPTGSYSNSGFFSSASSVEDDLIVGMTAMRIVQGDGMIESNTSSKGKLPFVDIGYDQVAEAYLFGKIIIGGTTTGQTSLIAGPNALGISNDGQVFNATFNAVQINVTPSVLFGDINLDGYVNLLDVADFVDRISTNEYQAEADINQDELVNLLDVEPFVQILTDI